MRPRAIAPAPDSGLSCTGWAIADTIEPASVRTRRLLILTEETEGFQDCQTTAMVAKSPQYPQLSVQLLYSMQGSRLQIRTTSLRPTETTDRSERNCIC